MPAQEPKEMGVAHSMTSTTFDLPGYHVVRNLGLVRGITVRSTNLGNQIVGSFRTIIGGEIHEYVELAEQSRETAFNRMLMHATEMGANAVLGVRYDANEMMPNMNEVIAYGTAVIVERNG